MVRVEENKDCAEVSPSSFLVRLATILLPAVFIVSPTDLPLSMNARDPNFVCLHRINVEEKSS